MRELAYDLHIHSCLSPCGDDESTPASIAGMAKVIGLDMAALTDHNACGNCPAFFQACKAYGVVPVAGMELTTAEDIHLVCLFPTLASAMDFEGKVRLHRMHILNKAEVFGNQTVMNAEDEPIGTEPELLIAATDLTLEQGTALCRSLGGAAFPAHVDRESNGILAVLGDMPEEPDFRTIELHDAQRYAELKKSARLSGRFRVVSSDAHVLADISEPVNRILLDVPSEADDDQVRAALMRLLNTGGRS